MSEAFYASGSSAGKKSLLATALSSASVSDILSSSAKFKALIREGLKIGVQLNYKGVLYDGWVFNANTYAASRYSGFNFNSFCQYQDKYYGCNSSGIYSLGADDDNGELIEAYVTTGNIKPMENRMARVHDAYLLVKNDGEMYLTVTTNGQPYTHEITTINSTHQENRIKLGKKTKSVIWQFEIGNVAGSDFDIESFKIYPIELTRHI